ncbi:alpha/beta-hydrolase [Abortiporus biennis]|nr:alpha/beta-hydrolase [Abortiporus biennis]
MNCPHSLLLLLSFVISIIYGTQAVPIPIRPSPLFGISRNSGATSSDNVVPVSPDTVTSQLLRPALFSRLSYCSTRSVQSLSCGGPCDAVKGIEVLQAGGDNGEIPGFFIANDPVSQSVVIAHQGTNPLNLMSVANDVEIDQVGLNSTLFPSSASGALVHDGFQATQGRTADLVLSTVQAALSSTGYKRVLVTGHSLGASIALLDATMLKMQLPSDTEIDSVVFGLPRTGNQAFADMIDSLVGNNFFPAFTHVTNQHDPVPDVPPQLLSYQHPSGEIHITSVSIDGNTATLQACPGQENKNCADGNNLLDSSILDHLGPYFDDISFSSFACPV